MDPEEDWLEIQVSRFLRKSFRVDIESQAVLVASDFAEILLVKILRLNTLRAWLLAGIELLLPGLDSYRSLEPQPTHWRLGVGNSLETVVAAIPVKTGELSRAAPHVS